MSQIKSCAFQTPESSFMKLLRKIQIIRHPCMKLSILTGRHLFTITSAMSRVSLQSNKIVNAMTVATRALFPICFLMAGLLVIGFALRRRLQTISQLSL